MGLTNVWLCTLADGLVRADQVIGVRTHRTPSATGKPSHWLLDVVLPTGIGGGHTQDWALGPVHRTLIQTSAEPAGACEQLVRLLAQLDAINAAGIITTSRAEPSQAGAPAGTTGAGAVTLRFRFAPFKATAPERHDDPEYL